MLAPRFLHRLRAIFISRVSQSTSFQGTDVTRRRLRPEQPEAVKTVKRLETLTLKPLMRAVLACVRLGNQNVRIDLPLLAAQEGTYTWQRLPSGQQTRSSVWVGELAWTWPPQSGWPMTA
jgi:hypothetical protein